MRPTSLHLFLLSILTGLCLTMTAFSQIAGHCDLAGIKNNPKIDCGFLEVPENREDKGSRTIQVAYMRIKSNSDKPQQDPVIFLQGGPGASVLQYARGWLQNPILNNRDLILVDQRGTGFSSAFCPELGSQLVEVLGMDLSPKGELKELKKRFATCKKAMDMLSVDISGYSSIQNAADIKDLILYLGYDKANLFGGSYGSRLAWAVMRDHPEVVRTAILAGPLPPEINMYENMIPAFRNSLEKMFAECASDSHCQSKYPDLRNTFFELVRKLEKEPLKFENDGKVFVINAQDALFLVHQLLYSRQSISLIPSYIYALKDKDEEVLRKSVLPLFGRINIINFAMNIAVQAYDESAFNDYKDYKKALKQYPEYSPGMAFFNSDVQLHNFWQPGKAPKRVNELVKSDIPALVLVGEYDPITPPFNGRSAIKGLTNAHLIEFDGEGHSIYNACFYQMMLYFFDHPMESPDTTCVPKDQNIVFK